MCCVLWYVLSTSNYMPEILCDLQSGTCRRYKNIENTALTATSKSYLCMKWPDGERLYFTAGKKCNQSYVKHQIVCIVKAKSRSKTKKAKEIGECCFFLVGQKKVYASAVCASINNTKKTVKRCIFHWWRSMCLLPDDFFAWTVDLM